MSVEEVVMASDLAQEIVKEMGLMKEKAWKKDDYGFEDIFVKEEVTIENALVEEVDGIAGRKCLHKEKGTIDQFKKGGKVKHYPCKEPGCGKIFGGKNDLNRHRRSVHLKEKPHHCDEPGCDRKFG